MPPALIITSALSLAFCRASVVASISSGTLPISIGSIPNELMAPINKERFELYICPRCNFSPGSTNSSPVENIATRSRLYTDNRRKPTDESKPICSGFIQVPCLTITSPRLISWPRDLTCCLGVTEACTVTTEFSSVQTSWATTVLAPAGNSAPVKIRAAVFLTRVSGATPAGTRCLTGRLKSCSAAF